MNDQLTIKIKGSEVSNQSPDDVKASFTASVTATYGGTVDSCVFDTSDQELTIKVTVADTATRATDKAMVAQIVNDLGGEFNVDASEAPQVSYYA